MNAVASGADSLMPSFSVGTARWDGRAGLADLATELFTNLGAISSSREVVSLAAKWGGGLQEQAKIAEAEAHSVFSLLPPLPPVDVRMLRLSLDLSYWQPGTRLGIDAFPPPDRRMVTSCHHRWSIEPQWLTTPRPRFWARRQHGRADVRERQFVR